MQKTNWVCTSGDVKESKGTLTYTPNQAESAAPSLWMVHGITRSNCYFSAGKINFELKLHGDKTHCQLIIGAGSNPIYFGINEGLQAYSIKAWDQQKIQYIPLGELGSKSSIPFNEWIGVEIDVEGSNLVLRISGVEVLRSVANVQRGSIAFAFWGDDQAEVKSVKASPVKPKVFAVMQFTEEFNEMYNDVIDPVCDDFDLQVVRADDVYNNGLIIQDIINSINESSLVIADITPDNPNVYYKVGFAHASAKPVILLCDSKREKLPFDLSGFRTIFYRNTIAGKSEVEAQLRKHLGALLPQN